MMSPDLLKLDHLFTHHVDTRAVDFVRPADTDRPTWAVYEEARYLGTVHAQHSGSDCHWHVQRLREQHCDLDDAIRVLRRPPTWQADQSRVHRWACGILNDPHMIVLDTQTTSLTDPWAVQIALTDHRGRVLFNERLNPFAEITPAATALHGITPEKATAAAPFSAFVPRLTRLLHGRRCLTYNAPFDCKVLERELHRHFGSAARARHWMTKCTWIDAMRPYAIWKGLWSAHRGGYRYQRLGSSYDAATNCRLLLTTLEQIR
ncbi:exonuclease domain-containing protein [Streptomyces sp. NPDC056738]|uniref:3'-5' exonuclease n=1 Tax=Streptomyces sp. NPDC056738 TaxID=3345933 RepID=UPI0036C5F831